jgi:hypothetical protein
MQHWTFLVIAILLFASPHARAEESPAQLAEDFYRWRLHPTAAEVANNGARKPYESGRRFFANELMSALEAQAAYERECARITPIGPPYQIDQDPFFRAPDGARALDSVRASVRNGVARVSADLSYEEIRWTDVVILRNVDGRWAIVEIEWGDGGSLTKRLVTFASYRCAT